MNQDKVSNLIISLKNAGKAGKDSITMPYSKINFAIAELLAKEGLVKSVNKKGKKVTKLMEVKIAYKDDKPVINGVERVSKLSKRIYKRADELRPIRNGYGKLILSTNKGLKTDKEARAEKVGGEALFKIW